MPKRPVVAGGGGDNAAAACGIGAVKPGAAFVSLGTSGVLFVSNDAFMPQCGARRSCLLPCGARTPGTRWASFFRPRRAWNGWQAC